MTAREASPQLELRSTDGAGGRPISDRAHRGPFTDLVSDIVHEHNLYIRCELVRLERLLETVCEEPCDEATELAELGRSFAQLRGEIQTLMEFEEETLFPLITRLERTPLVEADSPEAIGMMTAAQRQADAYDDSMRLLERVRSCALTYTPPEHAPLLYSCVLYDLANFDEELRTRVGLKKELFRRAMVELPPQRPRKGPHRASQRHDAAPPLRSRA